MLKNQPKVLILYASYGAGHYQASLAVKQSLTNRGFQVRLLDLMAEAHPLLNEVTKFVYMQSFKTIPKMYGWVYNRTKDMSARSAFGHVLHSFGIRQLAKALNEEQPDLVIHTFPQLALPALRRKRGIRLPIVNIITDFDLHGRWLHPEIDRYYVPTEDMKLEAIERGMDPERIVPSGIPVHASFHEMSTEEMTLVDEAIHQPNIIELNAGGDNKTKTILLLGGAYGVMTGMHTLCSRLAALPDVEVLVVCGRNESLRERLMRDLTHCSNIQIFGYVDHIAALMRRSDLVITKPGGITLSESLSSGLPILIYRPVPGQEMNNALYLERKGAALISTHFEQLIEQVTRILSAPHTYAAMAATARQLGKPWAAEHIAEDIIQQWFAPLPTAMEQ
ncbi:MGDG synthase family glycosyltransferase [Paenibacillus massiliensis]|uniref:MGDG synthase family glycosyltransferase n=1 Tax=Paenibacillus massiliensis TaxID=225917 RepID=UPI000472B103|nr:glycosyltransferase [Paenibacillus massiliensis]